MHGDRGHTIYNISAALLEVGPWLICRSTTALLQTEQFGVSELLIEDDEEMGYTFLDLGLCETCVQIVKQCVRFEMQK